MKIKYNFSNHLQENVLDLGAMFGLDSYCYIAAYCNHPVYRQIMMALPLFLSYVRTPYNDPQTQEKFRSMMEDPYMFFSSIEKEKGIVEMSPIKLFFQGVNLNTSDICLYYENKLKIEQRLKIKCLLGNVHMWLPIVNANMFLLTSGIDIKIITTKSLEFEPSGDLVIQLTDLEVEEMIIKRNKNEMLMSLLADSLDELILLECLTIFDKLCKDKSSYNDLVVVRDINCSSSPILKSRSVVAREDVILVDSRNKNVHYIVNEAAEVFISVNHFLLLVLYVNWKQGWIFDNPLIQAISQIGFRFVVSKEFFLEFLDKDDTYVFTKIFLMSDKESKTLNLAMADKYFELIVTPLIKLSSFKFHYVNYKSDDYDDTHMWNIDMLIDYDIFNKFSLLIHAIFFQLSVSITSENVESLVKSKNVGDYYASIRDIKKFGFDSSFHFLECSLESLIFPYSDEWKGVVGDDIANSDYISKVKLVLKFLAKLWKENDEAGPFFFLISIIFRFRMTDDYTENLMIVREYLSFLESIERGRFGHAKIILDNGINLRKDKKSDTLSYEGVKMSIMVGTMVDYKVENGSTYSLSSNGIVTPKSLLVTSCLSYDEKRIHERNYITRLLCGRLIESESPDVIVNGLPYSQIQYGKFSKSWVSLFCGLLSPGDNREKYLYFLRCLSSKYLSLIASNYDNIVKGPDLKSPNCKLKSVGKYLLCLENDKLKNWELWIESYFFS